MSAGDKIIVSKNQIEMAGFKERTTEINLNIDLNDGFLLRII